MSSIYDDAWKGNLDADSLKKYVASHRDILNKPGGRESLTPLAAACWRGHLDLVRLLLDNRADPNAVSSHNRTPLFYTTSRCPRERPAIVRALLDAGAKVDTSFPEDDDYTPLMCALVEFRDKEVVHELVDRGASCTVKNRNGETAEMLAKQLGMEQELRSRAERESSRIEIIDIITTLVLFVLSWVNTRITKGVVTQLYNVSGDQYDNIAKDIAPKALSVHDFMSKFLEMKAKQNSGTPAPSQNSVKPPPVPLTPQEFQDDLDTYVTDSGLEKFFEPGDKFLQHLAEKASGLRAQGSSLGTQKNIQRLTRLSLYQPVIYCDDSGSMDTGNRYRSQRELVERIASIATKIVPDNLGVELRFINSNSSSNLSAAQITAAINSVKPSGGTQIGTNLRKKILAPLVYDVLAKGQKLRRPLLVCTITDGCPSSEPQDCFREAIVECKNLLVGAEYEPTAVMFTVSQIGDVEEAKAFLDGLRDDAEIEEVLHCTTDRLDSKYQELKENNERFEEWLLKLLTMPIMGRDDEL
ncbi:hypothetical protein JB92DRAFT_2904697 [Gautieria morchelliformis]|nr:hypothetical protein JB92DRAFT_2904697 [Gautieria morchelliformis]